LLQRINDLEDGIQQSINVEREIEVLKSELGNANNRLNALNAKGLRTVPEAIEDLQYLEVSFREDFITFIFWTFINIIYN
jgi:predicted  nucleic acid-binding Zn-ribbon protein